MAPNAEIVEWANTAPGVAMNPDGHYGNQCVDLPDQYAQDIFGVPWAVSMGGVQGAKQLLDAAPDKYWKRTDNDPKNPALLPKFGDVLVYGGVPGVNDWGHTAFCVSADAGGCWVIQQDGFAAPLIYVDGNWYSNKPAHKAYLPHYGPGTGLLIGWLSPREEMIIGYKKPVVAPATSKLLGYQRATQKVNKVGFRKTPVASGTLIKWLDPDKIYDFKGFVRSSGQVWFVGRYTDGFAWAGGFLDEGTHDLPDLTAQYLPAPKPVPVPPVAAPAPKPPAVPAPAPAGAFLNGIDVAKYQEAAALQSLATDFYGIKASEGGSEWSDAALASNVAEARLSGKPVGFYHYARPLATPENTARAEAESFLAVIKPYLQSGDWVALDWEAENQHRTDWALEWLQIVQDRTGAKPFIYLNALAINGPENGPKPDWSTVEKQFPLWYAGYGANPMLTGFKPPAGKPNVTWAYGVLMWQYGSKGRLQGYAGDLDFNVFYGSAGALRALGAKVALKDPEPTAPVPTTPPATTPSKANDAAVLTRFFSWLIDLFGKSGK